jgi:hypothetical protein
VSDLYLYELAKLRQREALHKAERARLARVAVRALRRNRRTPAPVIKTEVTSDLEVIACEREAPLSVGP